MWIRAFRCVCGFEVRALLAHGCATFRPDPEAWQKLCAYSNQLHAPKDCPRFLEAAALHARVYSRANEPSREARHSPS